MGQPGEMAELDRAVREHLPALLRLATRLCGNATTADEIVQQALYRAVRGWASFRGDSSPRTWLWRIVIHAYRDQLSASARLPTPTSHAEMVVAERADNRQSTPLQESLDGELRQVVAAQIGQLPLRQREVLVLSVYEQCGAAEIAALLEINENNVYATLSQARSRLKRALAPYLDGRDHER